MTRGIYQLAVGEDIIIEADGKKTETIQEFQNWLEFKPTVSKLKIYRKDSIIELTLSK